MYSSSPVPNYAIYDRRPTLGTMDSPQQQQQSWNPIPMLKQPQDMDMDYMAHHGYHVTPTSINSSSPQYHPFAPQSPSTKQQMNRAVIPSKRAAQNRAAQKAFRQRRDRYVKDLEKKSKEMEAWKQELDTIKDENRQLKSLVHQLEQRISSLKYQQVPENGGSPITATTTTSSSSSITVLSPTIPSPRSPSLPTPSTSSNSHPSSSPSPTISSLMPTHPHIPSPSPPQQQTGHSFLLPISLRPHSFIPFKDESVPSTTPTSSFTTATTISSSSSFVVAAPAGQVAASTFPAGHPPLFELDLDPFFDDDFGFPRMDDQLDFVGHTSGGQVLDDLFAMLQTRQRPQIPLQPHQKSQQGDQPPTHYSMVDHALPNQHSSSSSSS